MSFKLIKDKGSEFSCHICGTLTEEDWVCKKCDQHYHPGCAVSMTYHNQIDYNCCSECEFDPREESYLKVEATHDTIESALNAIKKEING